MNVDVEGYRPEVIRSASAILERSLSVDFHGSILAGRGGRAADVDADITAHGYVGERRSPRGGNTVCGAVART